VSLQASPVSLVPELTARVAHAAFPKGNPYLRLRDEFGTIFRDTDFADLYPRRGQPALPPWQLALVTVLQFRESLSDRKAADAVPARIDWKYLLGLELDDPGFDFSVLSEFRSRLLAGEAGERLLEKLLDRCKDLDLIKERGRQRTDATHVMASIRVMNRLELLGETLRAALNELAGAAPEWIKGVAPAAWYQTYARRVEDSRLPKEKEQRQAYAEAVGADGFVLLDRLGAPEAPPELRQLEKVEVLRLVWERHYQREGGRVHLKSQDELPPAAEAIESPYDPEARFRSKRETNWTGYMAVLTETCDEGNPNLITHVDTTAATVHEVHSTATVQEALAGLGLAPGEHLADAGFITAELLVSSREDRGIELIGPPRPGSNWQGRVAGAYGIDQFEVDWENRRVHCPEGHQSNRWLEYTDAAGKAYISARFAAADCAACPARAKCTRSAKGGRHVRLPSREQHEATEGMRRFLDSEEGRRVYARRSGIEGTISQGVRSFGLRRARYRGEAKTHLQHVATAAAMNISRISDWLEGKPPEQTRTSCFTRLAA
jgi:transposase